MNPNFRNPCKFLEPAAMARLDGEQEHSGKKCCINEPSIHPPSMVVFMRQYKLIEPANFLRAIIQMALLKKCDALGIN
jgi:hypothetical protein